MMVVAPAAGASANAMVVHVVCREEHRAEPDTMSSQCRLRAGM